jgi:hypothetical protein
MRLIIFTGQPPVFQGPGLPQAMPVMDFSVAAEYV